MYPLPFPLKKINSTNLSRNGIIKAGGGNDLEWGLWGTSPLHAVKNRRAPSPSPTSLAALA